jgi:hypothetical protein
MSLLSQKPLVQTQILSSESFFILAPIVTHALPRRQALERLMDDGIIFSTINETHFQISQ